MSLRCPPRTKCYAGLASAGKWVKRSEAIVRDCIDCMRSAV